MLAGIWRNWNYPTLLVGKNGTTALERVGLFLKKLNGHLLRNSVSPRLSVHLGEKKTGVHTKACMQLFTAALFCIIFLKCSFTFETGRERTEEGQREKGTGGPKRALC